MGNQIKQKSVKRPTRRKFLSKGLAIAGGLAAPHIWVPRASAAGQVICSNPGGTYGEALTKAIYEPFTKATGIEVVPINVVTSKLLAMVEANKIELDVLDRNEIAALILRKRAALLPIDYKDFKFTNPEDIASVSRPDMCPYCSQASVIVYNTDVFRGDNHPRSCADVWDTQRFPGPRIFQSFDIGFAELEFALLADGVPIDKLYPLDVDRAFKSLSRIKPSVVQFYNTGGTQLAMYSSKEAVTGSGYNGRIQPGIDNKQPLGIEWNQANIQYQIMAILKGCPNEANARKFLDFALQPQMQAEFAKYIPYGPTNKQAMKYISREVAAKLPTNYFDRAFVLDVQWWADNRARVGEVWSKWILGK